MRVNLKPVSINRAYRGGRRFKTKDYIQFEKDMLLLLSGKIQKFPGNYAISFKFYLKNALACDLSNFVKTTEDCIVKAGIVNDDRFCWRMVVEKYKSEQEFFEFEIIELPEKINSSII